MCLGSTMHPKYKQAGKERLEWGALTYTLSAPRHETRPRPDPRLLRPRLLQRLCQNERGTHRVWTLISLPFPAGRCLLHHLQGRCATYPRKEGRSGTSWALLWSSRIRGQLVFRSEVRRTRAHGVAMGVRPLLRRVLWLVLKTSPTHLLHETRLHPDRRLLRLSPRKNKTLKLQNLLKQDNELSRSQESTGSFGQFGDKHFCPSFNLGSLIWSFGSLDYRDRSTAKIPSALVLSEEKAVELEDGRQLYRVVDLGVRNMYGCYMDLRCD